MSNVAPIPDRHGPSVPQVMPMPRSTPADGHGLFRQELEEVVVVCVLKKNICKGGLPVGLIGIGAVTQLDARG